ncbi:MAG: ribonuclease P protein component [Propionibacteriaceae bacterium]|nr:ribonuclease P protein component [Propionibacteriaceae bacterium]
MLPKRHRLTRPEDYRAVLRGGDGRRRTRVGTDLLVVHASLADNPELTRPPRVGFVVSKAVGGSVVRHRVVRRLRAQMAERIERLHPGTDLVVRARPAAAGAASGALGEALDHALGRILKGAA